MIGAYYIRLVIVAGLLLPAPLPARSNVHVLEDQSAAVADQGKYYAIVIGINKYHSPLPSLITAVSDARAMAYVLTQSYGFQVKLLLDQDATRVNILDAIVQFRDTLNKNDSLLIYYAGHGYSDHASDKAYWLPADADSVYSSNRIIADELTTDVRVQNARHVLIISDSCFSGGLSRGADAPTETAGRVVFLNRMLTSRSRTLMASGGDEPVSDSGTDGHSVFAYAVLRSLQQIVQPVFTASDLFYGLIRQQVAGKSDQLPQYSIIRNSSHDDGDFVFMKKQTNLRISEGVTSDVLLTDQKSASKRTDDGFVVLKAPVGGEIHLDQQFSGHSTGDPTKIIARPGERVVEVFLPGYLPWKSLIQVESGEESFVVASLVPVPAADMPLTTQAVGVLNQADSTQVQQLIARYEFAVNNKDVKQLKAVWPEIPVKTLDQYKNLPKGARITLKVKLTTLVEGNDNAIVKCTQTYQLDAKTQEDSVTFYIGRFNSGWIINEIPSSN